MATVLFTGNAQNTPQVVTITVGAVAGGCSLVATINGKQVAYLCLQTDTAATAASAWLLALQNVTTAPPEFQEIAWANPTAGVITATAAVPGTPFAGMPGGLTTSATGGCAVSQVQTTPNSSQSDVADPRNYLRNGSPSLPQAGDDFVLANSSVPLLWNLTALAGIALNSFTRWQSHEGQVGLPPLNPNGYYEYRGTYLKLSGPASGGSSSSSSSSGGAVGGVLQAILGVGQVGSGPSLERYDFGSQQTNLQVLASGSPSQDYAVYFLGSNLANVVSLVGASLGVAMQPGESASLASASIDGGGALALGPGCGVSGTVTCTTGTLVLDGCAPGGVVAQQGSQVVQTTTAAAPVLTFPSVVLASGSICTWLSGSNIASLVTQTSSIFDKSQDLRPMQVTNYTTDADTCQYLDPYNATTFLNPIVLNNAPTGGPIVVGRGRTVKYA